MSHEDLYNVSEIMDLPGTGLQALVSTTTTSDIFDDDSCELTPVRLPGKLKQYSYVPWGQDNQIPYNIISKVEIDEIMSQNKMFNVLTCYGAGLRFFDLESGQKTKNPDVARFAVRNYMPQLFLEQVTDFKYFYWSLLVVILDKEGKHIVQLRHKDVENIRLSPARGGRVEYAFYGDFREGHTLHDDRIEVIPLLDQIDPIGDLMQRMGLEVGNDGIRRNRLGKTERKFGILTRFPIPGARYYPIPYYAAIFRGDWYAIKRLISTGLKQKIKNTGCVRYLVEVHRDYWSTKCKEAGISDPVKVKAFIAKEKQNIREFLMGIENSGKTWISSYYTDPTGKEQHMVRITTVDTTKPGGDWAEDIQEAANMLCYADGIHPNLVGAVPGKSQSNNSGSDKRELFTMKQALEQAFHDVMLLPYHVVLAVNGWADTVGVDVPMITLTTLDENADAKKRGVNTDPKSVTE
jgi:hypothetical protein